MATETSHTEGKIKKKAPALPQVIHKLAQNGG